MAKASDRPLNPNPFTTYRDPDTGLWITVKTTSLLEQLEKNPPLSPESDRPTYSNQPT